jgi:hypothetical protein
MTGLGQADILQAQRHVRSTLKSRNRWRHGRPSARTYRARLQAAFIRPEMSRVSVEWLTFRTLLVALYSHDTNTLAQDRSQLGVAVNCCMMRWSSTVASTTCTGFEAIGDLLECPGLLVHVGVRSSPLYVCPPEAGSAPDDGVSNPKTR